MSRRHIKIAIISVIAVVVGWFLLPIQHIEPGKAGLTWNPFTGKVGILNPGWNVTGLTTFVTEIDTRPQRVCLTSATHAAQNCRLVQFDIRHTNEFIAVEGWRWYWWANRFSFNSGYHETYRGFRDVLRGYAFSAERYPFIVVLEEYQ